MIKPIFPTTFIKNYISRLRPRKLISKNHIHPNNYKLIILSKTREKRNDLPHPLDQSTQGKQYQNRRNPRKIKTIRNPSHILPKPNHPKYQNKTPKHRKLSSSHNIIKNPNYKNLPNQKSKIPLEQIKNIANTISATTNSSSKKF